MATVRIVRNKDFECKLRDYQIYVDGKYMFGMGNGETRCITLNEGYHTIIARLDWCTSKKFHLNLKDQDFIDLKVTGCFVSPFTGILALIIISIAYYQFPKLNSLSYIILLLLPLAIYFFTLKRNHFLKIKHLNNKN